MSENFAKEVYENKGPWLMLRKKQMSVMYKCRINDAETLIGQPQSHQFVDYQLKRESCGTRMTVLLIRNYSLIDVDK